ncbi:hypothetical protein T492DRAFT_945661 [Pavlovales sp. CCMP2436]|nr:hypothetical protein T492DRAFT_945661 [Pavlovales sp. CCMP2436]
MMARFIIVPAEHGFVEDDNLEPGEVLVAALKAFEARADGNDAPFDTSELRLLVAAALVEDPSGTRTLWIGDSLDSGVGPNMQGRAALQLVDELVLLHLRSSSVATSSADGAPSTLFAAAPLGTASRLALRHRGFVSDDDSSEVVDFDLVDREDNDDDNDGEDDEYGDDLRFCRQAASSAYACAAIARTGIPSGGESAGDTDSSVGDEILRFLS